MKTKEAKSQKKRSKEYKNTAYKNSVDTEYSTIFSIFLIIREMQNNAKSCSSIIIGNLEYFKRCYIGKIKIVTPNY